MSDKCKKHDWYYWCGETLACRNCECEPEDYIKILESKLSKAVECLKKYSEMGCCNHEVATKCLAEIEGDL